MIFPNRKGAKTVGIFAPSAGVGHKLESFDLSLDAIRDMEFSIIETDSVRNDSHPSADAKRRAAELRELVDNDSVGIILSASGGDFCLEMLEYIDFDAIKKKPVWICGASDPTAVLYCVTTGLDIATIYGVNAGSFDWRPIHIFQSNALSIFDRITDIKITDDSGSESAGKELPHQRSFDMYDGCRDYSRDGVVLDSKVEWISVLPGDDGVSSEINVDGRLIGGCIDVLMNIWGTRFDHTDEFLERYRDDGIIWYFDAFDMSPETLYLSMIRLKYSGYLKYTNAVIFGRVMFVGNRSDEEYVELLRPFFSELGIPFIFNADIGHVKPCMTLVNGAMVAVHSAGGKGEIRQFVL